MCDQVNREYFNFQYPFPAQKWLSKHPTSKIFLAPSGFTIPFFPPFFHGMSYIVWSLLSDSLHGIHLSYFTHFYMI